MAFASDAQRRWFFANQGGFSEAATQSAVERNSVARESAVRAHYHGMGFSAAAVDRAVERAKSQGFGVDRDDLSHSPAFNNRASFPSHLNGHSNGHADKDSIDREYFVRQFFESKGLSKREVDNAVAHSLKHRLDVKHYCETRFWVHDPKKGYTQTEWSAYTTGLRRGDSHRDEDSWTQKEWAAFGNGILDR